MLVRRQLDPEQAWFADARFGMFIHFGLYALLGRGEWVMYHEQIPRRRYEKLARRFTLEAFDAGEWADAAAAARCRYVCVTAKHHDGFCLFHSDLTDYHIGNTPFGRDLIGELIAACHQRGLKILLYYSQPDWHHPNFVHRPGAFKDLPAIPSGDEPDWDRYVDCYHGQVRELCTNYGPIDGIWFDGVHKSEQEWRGRRLYRLIRDLQPGAVVNERAGYGDFFTPERSLAAPAAGEGYLVESCQSVCADAWGWKDDAVLHSTPYLLESLVRMAAVGGNYLLNIGPRPDGSLPADQVARLEGISGWLADRGEAIFSTRGAHAAEEPSGVLYTWCRDRAYAHLLRWPETDQLELHRLRRTPVAARLLDHLDSADLRVERKGGVVRLRDLPSRPPYPGPNVVELSFDGEPRFRRPPRPPAPAPVAVGHLTRLGVEGARCSGFGSKGHLPAVRTVDGQTSVRLTSPEHHAVWRLTVDRGGRWAVTLHLACPDFFAGGLLRLEVGKARLEVPVPATGGQFREVVAGPIELPAGATTLRLRPTSMNYNYFAAEVRGVALRRG